MKTLICLTIIATIVYAAPGGWTEHERVNEFLEEEGNGLPFAKAL